MKNISSLYRFSDFTLSNYEKLLGLAKNNYEFVFFNELLNNQRKIIALRHDVEFSVPIALKMAKIENSLGIRSTWLFQVHGDFYNLLEKKTADSLNAIHKMGHKIGLHFDSHFWNISNEEELEKYINIDKSIFTTYFNIEPTVFSFHNTNSFVLSCEKETYAGMINVYSKRIKENCGYCSDSTGFWRFEILEEKIKEAIDTRLQILIHDGMWQDEPLPPRRRIFKVIDDHAKFMKKSYDSTLKKFKAKNIDWQGEVE